MPFDSNGTFNRVIAGGWKADAAAGIKIVADRHDLEDDGFATGLSTCITKDGRTQPTADIPMNNKKITNLGEPTGTSDAATKNYVDTFKSFGTGLTVSGAGPINGFINFASPTGVNGIGWETADMSWVGKDLEASKWSKRLAVNNTKDGTGTDVYFIDVAGRLGLQAGLMMQNTSYDGTAWRTIAAGQMNYLSMSGGQISYATNDTATTSAFQTATPRTVWQVSGGGTMTLDGKASAVFVLDKSASAQQCAIYGKTGGEMRWNMELGNTAAESSTYTGSNFVLTSYNNDGAGARTSMQIDRASNDTYFYGDVRSSSQFFTSSTTCILAAANGGSIYLRPNGPASATEQCYISTTGDFHCSTDIYVGDASHTSYGLYSGAGVMGKTGSGGSYTGSWHNSYWNGTYLYLYVNTSLLGAVTWQCDYRIKKNVKPLGTMWDKIKSLNPVSFQQKAYDIFVDNDTVRWGFLAHELQEKLIDSAALGKKDEPNVIQNPDLLAVIAALTKGLQEAMGRIETLEAARAA